jgi:3-dehydroquinate synthase
MPSSVSNHASISIQHARGAYPVIVGSQLLKDALSIISQELTLPPQIIVIVDSNIPEQLIFTLNKIFSQNQTTPIIIPIPGGENAKTFTTFIAVSEIILENHISRNTPIIAVGGGAIGDLAGFIAASLLRGLPLVHIPTTLLAMVDSSIGGKTAINSRHGKNLIGAIHQPQLVISDTQFLSSLPKRHFRAAYAEIVKYALIQNAPLFTQLDKNLNLTREHNENHIQELILASVRAKKQIVEADEFENNQRALLNLGHTFGHALETMHSQSDTLIHGEAVAIGIVLAFRFAHRINLIPKETLQRIVKHIHSAELPCNIPPDTSIDTMISFMKNDKKNLHHNISLILPHDIGHTSLHKNISPHDLNSFLSECIKQPLTPYALHHA